jgi:hypothetical protein
MDEGIQIDRSDEHSENAEFPRFDTRQPASKTTFERPVHAKKHDSEIVSIDDGIRIDRSERQLENAHFPRFDTLQPGVNITLERFGH